MAKAAIKALAKPAKSQLPFGEQGDSYSVQSTKHSTHRSSSGLNCLSANRVIHIGPNGVRSIGQIRCLNCLSANRVIHIKMRLAEKFCDFRSLNCLSANRVIHISADCG